MSCFLLYLAVLGLQTGAAATDWTFTRSGEMDITNCPITYFGQKYHKLYVAFNDSRFALCFNGAYEDGAQNDCIVMSGGTADRGNWSVLAHEIPAGSGVHKMLPELKHAGKCVNVIPLKDHQYSEIQQVELGNFGAQSILAIRTYPGYTDADLVAYAQVKGQTVSKHVFQANETSVGVITDMSGCRLSGSVYMINTTISDPDVCATVTCDVNGLATAVSECAPMHHCQGNGSCAFDAMCTLTASTVIDFVGRVHTVTDRCGYTLMKSGAVPNVRIQGVFKERRRKDVSFLDHVIVHLDKQDVKMELLQGGRVEINDISQALDTTVTVVHGVELTKDQSGVTAKISQSNYTVTVFFDGNTVQIHLKGESAAAVHGLCGNSSVDLSEERVSEHSIAGCETQHEEAKDGTINCNASTEWCQLMWQDPFTRCHMQIDPEPFVLACISNLCQSPAVDGLKCHLMEAYARACHQQNNITVEDWRSTAGCGKEITIEGSCQPNPAITDIQFLRKLAGVKTHTRVTGTTRCPSTTTNVRLYEYYYYKRGELAREKTHSINQSMFIYIALNHKCPKGLHKPQRHPRFRSHIRARKNSTQWDDNEKPWRGPQMWATPPPPLSIYHLSLIYSETSLFLRGCKILATSFGICVTAAGPEAMCRDKFCSDHEFCGVSYDGKAHCLCRALLASDYRSKDKFGEPAVCSHTSASVTMYCCLLLEKGIDYPRLHLNDESCKGDIDDKTHMVSFNFDRDHTCGAIIKANSSKITYKNVIMTPNISSVVTRYSNVQMDFSCHFDQPDPEGLAIKIKDSPVIKHLTSGEWDYTLTLTAYTDPGRTQPIESSTGVLLNEKIWVEIKAYGLEGNTLSIVTESCWATDQLSSNGSIRYDLITAGCPNPADSTVDIEGNGQGTSNYFSFNMFRFLGKDSEIFLHCRVDLCVQQADSCIQVCDQAARRRRSLPTIDAKGDPSIVTMAWA
ncbi:alpha-tectorin-like [Entelurus aequoreus]|uniref:alpha-tectorin-like n=1 Tax=Entelurus aequoreus TaxID=161455 RepID=UPI002B1D253B|nr:alpha-tectorin-like [Entelurus aequoreus]